MPMHKFTDHINMIIYTIVGKQMPYLWNIMNKNNIMRTSLMQLIDCGMIKVKNSPNCKIQ